MRTLDIHGLGCCLCNFKQEKISDEFYHLNENLHFRVFHGNWIDKYGTQLFINYILVQPRLIILYLTGNTFNIDIL